MYMYVTVQTERDRHTSIFKVGQQLLVYPCGHIIIAFPGYKIPLPSNIKWMNSDTVFFSKMHLSIHCT